MKEVLSHSVICLFPFPNTPISNSIRNKTYNIITGIETQEQPKQSKNNYNQITEIKNTSDAAI